MCALRLYPADYRARFATEMRATFQEALSERQRAILPFLITELSSVIAGAAGEWLSKLTTDAADRGRRLPDCSKMRPIGVTRPEWAAGLEWIDFE
jgi:hypothetical protein